MQVETRQQARDGTLRDVLATFVRSRLDGRPIIYAAWLNITEQRRAERTLAESEARFRGIANALPQMVFTTLPDGRTDYVNDRIYQFTGLPKEAPVNRRWQDLLHPDEEARVPSKRIRSAATDGVGRVCPHEGQWYRPRWPR